MVVSLMRSQLCRWTFLLAILAGLAGCDDGIEEAQRRAVTLTVWLHAASPGELREIQSQVAAFNGSQYEIRVNAVVIPGENYDVRLQEAARNNRLPDLIEIASHELPQYAWRGLVAPIDKHLTDHSTEEMPPAALSMGRYGGRVYGVARHIDETILFARRSVLESITARIPDSAGTAWSWREFKQIVQQLCLKNDGNPSLELPLQGQGHEVLQQLFPAIRSAGGALLDPASLTTVTGQLNGRPTIELLERLRGLNRSGCLDTNGGGDRFFVGHVSLLWANSREYARLKSRFGDDLVVLPLPDFGHGARTTPSGWLWALSTGTSHPQAAMSLLEFMREDNRLLAIADIAHDLPPSLSALADSSRYGPGSDLSVMADLLRNATVDLPPTPALPLLARRLGGVLPALIHGQGAVKPELDRVAMDLDRKIKGFEQR